MARLTRARDGQGDTPGLVEGARVLRTRLVPPRLPPGCLPRERLVERVQAALRGRLLAIIAGAGYGKSTLLAQALASAQEPWVWLSCDERIAGGHAFLAHLAAAFGERFPGVGARLALSGDIPDQAAELCNEVLDTISDEFVLALDDVHRLAGQPAAEALALLVRDLPPNVHLALASRTELPITLARLRAGGVVELDEDALALTEEESAMLLRSAGLSLSPHVVSDVHRTCEGWIAGVLLSAQAGGRAVEPRGQRAESTQFDYLAEEVLLRQPPETQAFLLDSVVLERFTPALAEAVTGLSDAQAIIERLLAGHLFTIRLETEGGWYRYHHLFAAFLRRRLASRETERLTQLHRRAAEAWLALGEAAEAARHFLAAGEADRALDALEPAAEQLVDTPEADSLAECLEAAPRELYRRRPSLVLAHAALLFERGQYEESFAALERAIEELLAADEHERAALALLRLLQNLLFSGAQHRRAIETARRHLPRLDPESPSLPAVRIMVAGFYGFAGRYPEAEEELRLALSLPRAAQQPLLPLFAAATRAFHIDYQQGRGADAVRVLDQLIEELEVRGSEGFSSPLVLLHSYRFVVMSQLGRWLETVRAVEVWRQMGRQRGHSVAMQQLASWPLLSALPGLDRWDELEAEIALAAPAAARLGGTFAARLHASAARLAAHRGDRATLEHHLGLVPLETHAPASIEAMTQTDLALAAWEGGFVGRATQAAARAKTAAESVEGRWGQARAALVGALVWGPVAAGDELLAEALELTARFDLGELWTRRERRFAGRLLARALLRRLGPAGLAARLVAACGGEVFAECAAALAGAPTAVRAELAEVVGEAAGVEAEVVDRLLRDPDRAVRALAQRSHERLSAGALLALRFMGLGGFAVRRGDVLLRSADFGRERARALLAALLCAGRPVHREELLEWFWPHLAPARGVRAFHVTMHGLRRALQPELSRDMSASVVLADGESYRVVLGERASWDAAEFLALARDPAAAEEPDARLRRLRAAEAADAGPLYPEWPFAEWALPRRSEVQQASQKILEQLAEALAAAGQPQAATAFYQRLLVLDPEREAVHRRLMQAYAQAGERTLALRQYHACRALLRRELGVEASAETRALYQDLLSG